jgi:hypothetical protein
MLVFHQCLQDFNGFRGAVLLVWRIVLSPNPIPGIGLGTDSLTQMSQYMPRSAAGQILVAPQAKMLHFFNCLNY